MSRLDKFAFREESKNEEKKWEELLKEVKVSKDNVGRKDIWLTKTEVDIIDTPEFQRLRRIFQLGPAHLLFTGATHTRLEHSIGTLHKAKEMIDAINRNYANFKQGRKLNNRETFLVRTAALLHDVIFVTYGHILEDEGRLLPKQWKDKARVERFLRDENSNIRKKISENICKIFGEERGQTVSNEIVEQLINVLSTKTEKDVRKLGDLAFVADIIHNTICADLLDYLERDVHNTGVFGEYDPRMISYFTIQNVNGQDRLVIKLYKKDVNEPIRWDVVSSILKCLRLRCDLATSIYLHHCRREASAMIIKMVSAVMKAGKIDREKIYVLDDFALPYFILNLDEEGLTNDAKKDLGIAKALARKILDRVLYKPVWELSREMYARDSVTMNRLGELTDWKLRFDFETTLEKWVGVESGSTILYIPDELVKKEPGMGLKEANVLVETKYGIETLENLGNREEFFTTIGREIENLKSRHKALFKASLFVSPELRERSECTLMKAICEQWFENKVPSSVIEVVASREKIELKEKPTIIAQQLHHGFLNTPFRPKSGISRFSEFAEYVSSHLKK